MVSTSPPDPLLTPGSTFSTMAKTKAEQEGPRTSDLAHSISDAGNNPVDLRYLDLSSHVGLDLELIRTPTGLMDLPNELLIPIINYTYAHHLENFARANKRIFNLSQDALKEHWKLKKEHSTAKVEPMQPGKPYPFGQLADHVVKNYRNPLLAEYVELVQVHHLDYRWPRGGKAAYPDYPLNSLVDMWRSLYGTIKRSTSDHAIRLLHRGSDEPVLALLLMCLPNIRFLKLEILFLDSVSLLIQAINHIIARKGPNAFSKLRTLWLSHSRLPTNLDLFKCMLHIPSVRVVKFSGMTDGPQHVHCANLAPKSSNITTLNLFDCNIGPRTLQSILTCMNQLKVFRIGWWSFQKRTELDPSQIRDSLEIRCKQTLQSLEMLGCHHSSRMMDKGYHYIGSLQAFTSLKDLSINIELLLPNGHDSDGTDFAAILPTSLESLIFHVNDRDMRRCFKRSKVARNFISTYHTLNRLPQLRNVQFRSLDQDSIDWLREIGLESIMLERGGNVDLG